MITNKNKKFLSKFGDVESREHLSALNGQHEIHLYDSPQQPTETMIKHSLNSPNWNAQMGAINSGMLTHEQAESQLHNHSSVILRQYTLKPDTLQHFAFHKKGIGHAGDIVRNALDEKRDASVKIDAVHKVIDAATHHNPFDTAN